MMTSEQRFGVLRTVLRALGLSPESTDDTINGIADLLAAEGDDAVHVQYWIPRAGQMTWSGLPPIRVGEYVAEW